MSAPNRASLLTKVHKVLRKHYKPVAEVGDRSVLEHLLYACCLENAKPEDADEAYARIQQAFFDWNEVRVTTVAELADHLSNLPDPQSAATYLKRSLQAVFEAHFAFDIEFLRKQNLGKSEKDLEKYASQNPFLIAYVVQNALGGHAIPCNRGALDGMIAVGALTEQEANSGRIPGVERAIAKSKGSEFSSLLQQLGADIATAPTSNRVRQILLEIEPQAKDRLPTKRKLEKPISPKRDERTAFEKALAGHSGAVKGAAEKAAATDKSAAEKATAPKVAAAKAAAAKGHVEKIGGEKHPADKAGADKAAKVDRAVKSEKSASEKASDKSAEKAADKTVAKSADARGKADTHGAGKKPVVPSHAGKNRDGKSQGKKAGKPEAVRPVGQKAKSASASADKHRDKKVAPKKLAKKKPR